MIVLKATTDQKNILEGIYNDAQLKFIQDINDNWVVNDNVLNDANFSEIHSQLSKLPKIDFKPKIDKI